MTDIQAFADRYVAIWNEADPATRRAAVDELWAPDATEYTDTREHRGHAALRERVRSSHDELVADKGYRFHRDGPAHGHHGTVAFRAVMRPAAGGDVEWSALIVARLDDEGRIREDHQFALAP
ncbi:nuclear transport factor 2 family protein [Pseudonocardia lacus]|uniref:nuclear transport factor 2 family protein n=1 Tax=Pseudonocardia lacus TaxID=2835865 RepID=UPI001BDC0BB8|nr:nuclear transport factor 2 family protein [Pseudonocardia lacus]